MRPCYIDIAKRLHHHQGHERYGLSGELQIVEALSRVEACRVDIAIPFVECEKHLTRRESAIKVQVKKLH